MFLDLSYFDGLLLFLVRLLLQNTTLLGLLTFFGKAFRVWLVKSGLNYCFHLLSILECLLSCVVEILEYLVLLFLLVQCVVVLQLFFLSENLLFGFFKLLTIQLLLVSIPLTHVIPTFFFFLLHLNYVFVLKFFFLDSLFVCGCFLLRTHDIVYRIFLIFSLLCCLQIRKRDFLFFLTGWKLCLLLGLRENIMVVLFFDCALSRCIVNFCLHAINS